MPSEASANYWLAPRSSLLRACPLFGAEPSATSATTSCATLKRFRPLLRRICCSPHLQFGLYDIITAVDHQTDRLQIIFCPPMERFLGEPREKLYREGLDRLAEWEARLSGQAAPLNELPSFDQMAFHPDQTRDAYLDRVRRCQEYIAAGDIYQANLSHRFTLAASRRLQRWQRSTALRAGTLSTSASR